MTQPPTQPPSLRSLQLADKDTNMLLVIAKLQRFDVADGRGGFAITHRLEPVPKTRCVSLGALVVHGWVGMDVRGKSVPMLCSTLTSTSAFSLLLLQVCGGPPQLPESRPHRGLHGGD
jgi:hypothetical protein